VQAISWSNTVTLIMAGRHISHWNLSSNEDNYNHVVLRTASASFLVGGVASHHTVQSYRSMHWQYRSNAHKSLTVLAAGAFTDVVRQHAYFSRMAGDSQVTAIAYIESLLLLHECSADDMQAHRLCRSYPVSRLTLVLCGPPSKRPYYMLQPVCLSVCLGVLYGHLTLEKMVKTPKI